MGRKHVTRRSGRDDSAQLMILAGIVLTLGFIVTSLTLAQLSELEREAASEKMNPLTAEWRFLHERLATNLEVAISEETDLDTFKDNILPRISATFRNVQEQKGYDVVIRVSDSEFDTSELSLVTSGSYAPLAVTQGGVVVTDAAYDGLDDGIIWEAPCPSDGRPGGCIVGVYLFVRLADPNAAIEEHILFAVNRA